MTAIVSNGYYLIADHRTTRTPVRQELVDHQTGKSRTSYTTDMTCKIIVPPKRTKLTLPAGGEQSRIIAAACAGNAENKYRLRAIFNNAKSGKFLEWSRVLQGFCPSITGVFKIVFVTENLHTVIWTIESEHIARITYEPGRIYSTGTGGTWLNLLSSKLAKTKIAKTLTPEQVFLAGAYLDKSSSSSYSVVGVKEKLHYPSVNPDPEYVKKVSREVWEKLTTEIHNHPKF